MDAVLVRTSVTAVTVNVQEAVSDPKTQTASYVNIFLYLYLILHDFKVY